MKNRICGASLAIIASLAVHSFAYAGAIGRPGVYSAPSPQGRVVVGTLPGAANQGHHGAGRHGHRGVNRTGNRTGNRIGVRSNGAQGLGPNNYYFNRGTGQTNSLEPAMPSVYFNARTNRSTQNGNRARVRNNRHSAGRTLTTEQVRRLTDQLPPRRTNNVIDPRSQASARESSGVRFGPQGKAMVNALATRKVAPASERNLIGYRQGAPRFANERDLPRFEMANHHGNQYIFAQGSWYLPKNGRLHPVVPPVGLTVIQLPTGYARVNRGSTEYFTADGVFLRRFAGGYVVVDAPQSDSAVPQ